MGIYDHMDALTQTDTFRNVITKTFSYRVTASTSDPIPRPEKPKGRAAFVKFHAKDIRKPSLR